MNVQCLKKTVTYHKNSVCSVKRSHVDNAKHSVHTELSIHEFCLVANFKDRKGVHECD